MKMLRALCFASLVVCTGCGVSSSTAMGAARASRPDKCDLMLVAEGDVVPDGKYADYEIIGAVTVSASAGAQATDTDVKNKVRPKACALGGELIAPSMSDEQILSFWVYAKKSRSAPQKY